MQNEREKADIRNGHMSALLSAQLELPKVNTELEKEIKSNWDKVAKPLDSMGVFETLLSRIGAIQGKRNPDLSKAVVLVMCADNGIVEEGVSQSDQSVTAICAENIAAGKSALGMMAAFNGADIEAVDIGMNTDRSIPKVRNCKVMMGTHNFLKEPAMSEKEALQAIETGMELVGEMKQKGYGIVMTGEMGIGNTTTSSAMTAAFLKCPAENVAGRGAGLSDAGLHRKQKVIEQALLQYHLLEKADPMKILCTVGGLDIAALSGICIGGAYYGVPILLDGVISMVAALTAERLIPGVKEYLIPSHLSKEPAALAIQQELGLAPVIDAKMALGEGTGAVMMLDLLKTANEVYQNSHSFEEYGIEQYQRHDV